MGLLFIWEVRMLPSTVEDGRSLVKIILVQCMQYFNHVIIRFSTVSNMITASLQVLMQGTRN